jgi:hypothetical protein
MKTIEHKGKVYLIDAVYEFSDDGYHWYTDILEDIHQGAKYPYKVRTQSYKFIKACEVKVGTITEAPVKLKNGECYRYTGLYGNERKGFFSARHDMFFRTEGRDAPSECTNIKLLVVGE